MPYFQRSFVSVAVIFVLLISLSALPETVSAKRCPVRIPDSLLTLYLKSDLVIIGSIKSEKTLKMTDDYDYGSYFDVEKNLDISKTLKGQKPESATFKISEFKPKNAENTDAEETKDNVNIGDKALFFLAKNTENGFYILADGSSGIKKLEDGDLYIYVKRIEELKRITTARKNQLVKLIEWLVRLVEEPATRAEGTVDLQASFLALKYEQEEQEENAKITKNADEKDNVSIKEPILLDKNFTAGSTSEIAKLLTDSQKQRISNVLLVSINADLVKFNNAESEEEITPDYELISLIKEWDKTTFAMNSFALLQNTDNSNYRKVSFLLNTVASFLEDEQLYEISSNYESALSEDDNALTEYSEEEAAAPEIIEESGTSNEVETTPEIQEAEKVDEKVADQVVEVVPVQVIEEIPVAGEVKVLDEPVKEEAVTKITYKQYKEKLLSKFARQYGIVIAQTSASK
jgi:hypothetical protein